MFSHSWGLFHLIWYFIDRHRWFLMDYSSSNIPAEACTDVSSVLYTASKCHIMYFTIGLFKGIFSWLTCPHIYNLALVALYSKCELTALFKCSLRPSFVFLSVYSSVHIAHLSMTISVRKICQWANNLSSISLIWLRTNSLTTRWTTEGLQTKKKYICLWMCGPRYSKSPLLIRNLRPGNWL